MVFDFRNLLPCLCLFVGTAFAQEQPKAQTPPPAPAAAPAPAPAQTPKPDMSEGTRYSGDGVSSFQLQYWFNRENPVVRTGALHSTEYPSNLDYPGKPKFAPGATLSIGVGNHHTLRVSYFQVRGQGNLVANQNIDLFAVGFNPGDYLSAGYKLQNVKVSLDYLSWPFPLRSARFRLKTLWEVQYTSIKSSVDAPLKPVEDSEGNAITTFGENSRWFVYPTLGLGVEYLLSKNVRWEAKGSGFALGGERPVVWDADTFLAYRSGQWEIQGGAKAFHFKTTGNKEEIFRGTLSGAYVGVRWYLK